MDKDNVLNRLVPRLKKIGIEIEMSGNIPWIYLEKVNGNRIRKKIISVVTMGLLLLFIQ